MPIPDHPIFELDVERFQAATKHLTVTQLGGLMFLVDFAWRYGSLPADHEELRKIAKTRRCDWKKFYATIGPLIENNGFLEFTRAPQNVQPLQ